MRLDFTKEDWLHILMATRIAQKVLTQGDHYTAAWNTQRGNHIIAQLMLLVKRAPNHPQIGQKIDLDDLVEMLPDGVSEAAPEPAAPPVDEGRLMKLEEEVTFLRQAMTNLGNSAALQEVAALRAFINQQNESIFEFTAKVDDRLLALERRP